MGKRANALPSTIRGGAGEEGETCQTGVVANLVQEATSRLAAALGLDRREARLEAQVLAARALGVNRAWLIAHDRDALLPAQVDAVAALISRREKGEPVAYILGEKEFYGRVFKVTPDVLIPRPETELLVEAALARLPQDRPARILDLGTGSGCIAITLALERPDCTVVAVDVSSRALAVAWENAAGLGAPVEFQAGDLFSSLAGTQFDLIVSNPPYIAAEDSHLKAHDVRHEPTLALVSGPEGLDALRLLISTAPLHLCAGGWLLLEHGWNQGDAVRALMAEAGFLPPASLRDMAGHNRVTLAQWNPKQ